MYLNYEEFLTYVNDQTIVESDFDIALLIVSKKIDIFCKNTFYPTTKTILLDGSGNGLLPLPYSILNIDSVTITREQNNNYYPSSYSANYVCENPTSTTSTYTSDSFGINKGDDPVISLYPYIEFKSQNLVFPKGSKNISIVGTFGCCEENSDPDSTEEFITPKLIKIAVARLILTEILKQDDDVRNSPKNIIKENTDFNSYELDKNSVNFYPTDDSQVNSILSLYSRSIEISVI